MQTTAPDNDEIRLATLGAFWYFCSMAAQQKSHRTARLAFNQRERRRPSQVKSSTLSRAKPGQNLQLACELSDLCNLLRIAVQKRR